MDNNSNYKKLKSSNANSNNNNSFKHLSGLRPKISLRIFKIQNELCPSIIISSSFSLSPQA